MKARIRSSDCARFDIGVATHAGVTPLMPNSETGHPYRILNG
jgi:hypothetical protein